MEEFLNVAVWPGRSDSQAEVVSVQLTRFDGDWKTLGRVTLYRTRDGAYSELPERSVAAARCIKPESDRYSGVVFA